MKLRISNFEEAVLGAAGNTEGEFASAKLRLIRSSSAQPTALSMVAHLLVG